MLISSQQREFIKWLAGLALTLAVILVMTEAPLKQILFGHEREPASVPAARSKSEILFPAEKRGLKAQGKGSGIVDVEIAAVAGGDSVLNLEATVIAQSNQDELKYAWILPTEGGVATVTGALEGSIGALAEGQMASVRLSIQTSTTDNRRVHLHVFKMVGGEAMGRMAQFNTVDQEKIDARLQKKVDILSAGTTASGEESQKLMQ